MAKKETGIVKWEEMMKTEAKEVAKTERPSVSRISLQSGIMTYQDTALPDNELICVIAAAIHEQVYYDKPFRQGVVNPPGCFAFGMPGDELKAHPDVGERDYGPDCSTCQMNQWGTAKRDGVATRGKACGERRKLATLPLLEKAEEYARAEIAIISLPVMSVANWKNYVNLLSAQYQRPCWGIITKIKVVPDPKTQFKVTFEDVGIIADDFMGPIHDKIESAMGVLMTPYDMTPVEDPKEEGQTKY